MRYTWTTLTKRLIASIAGLVCFSAIAAQETWVWNRQCDSNEWTATCAAPDPDGCGYDSENTPILRYFNNWGRSQCGSRPALPSVGAAVIFLSGAEASLTSDVAVHTIEIQNSATLSWRAFTLELRNPQNGQLGTLTNHGLLWMSRSAPRFLVGQVVNNGTVLHEWGTTNFVEATLQNNGVVELRSGNWSFYPPAILTRVINLGTIRKTSPYTFTINLDLHQENATIEVSEGALGVYAFSNTYRDVTWNVARDATLSLYFGVHTFSGVHSGRIDGAFHQVGRVVQIGNEGAVFNFIGNGYTVVSGVLNCGAAGLTNRGVLRMSGFYGRGVNGRLVNQGTLVHDSGVTTFGSATVENRGVLELQYGSWTTERGANASVQNIGTLRKVAFSRTMPGGFDLAVNAINSGLIEVVAGELLVSNLTQTAGETRLLPNAELITERPLLLQGGALTGAGRLSGAVTNNAATIAPGIDAPEMNFVGVLTIEGNLTMSRDAVLEVELMGTNNADPTNPQFDQIVISGVGRNVRLDGVLRVKARNGYVPASGDTFDVLVCSGSTPALTGTFHTVLVDNDTLPCTAFEVQYLSDRVRLVAQSTTSPDIDRSGCVDEADLLAVLLAFGQSGNALAADIVCDGRVDDADLLQVLFAFGQGC